MDLFYISALVVFTVIVSTQFSACFTETVVTSIGVTGEEEEFGQVPATTEATSEDSLWIFSTNFQPLNHSRAENNNNSNNNNVHEEASCRIRTTDPLMYSRIRQFLETDKLNLIEYKLRFANYSYNPLKTNVTRRHKADTWARVSTQHGQTLLSLAFNYGVLSLMTLTFGTTTALEKLG